MAGTTSKMTGVIGHRGQRYQNTFAFKHNPNSKTTKEILGIMHHGLCKRCNDKIEWRKRFRKYKPLKMPSRCNACQERSVSLAYHALCTGCASKSNVCPMCAKDRQAAHAGPGSNEEEDEADEAEDDETRNCQRANAKDVRTYLASLRERERRRLARQEETGQVVFYKRADGTLLLKMVGKAAEEDDAGAGAGAGAGASANAGSGAGAAAVGASSASSSTSSVAGAAHQGGEGVGEEESEDDDEQDEEEGDEHQEEAESQQPVKRRNVRFQQEPMGEDDEQDDAA
jgi:hypothetical protein